MSTEHENRQLGGLKATVHNPNTSPEAKAHAAEVLAEHGITLKANPPITEHGQHAQHAQHDGHGHPHVAHDGHHGNARAQTQAHAHGHGHAHAEPAHETRSHSAKKEEEEHEHRVLGGYKAAIHNPHVWEDAKEHAQQILKEHGVDKA
ncbi:hypothetical protein I316_07759 [Kwoniella heveanensis BCC8398]|uniref:Conidiation-specific protein 6 n=1 Tax=Kwoniella heveanensis BCC8398 TaxID=1296120 RepID=A0A1B9GI65_9TREE|nr:hypothetical protein I316_07759 [Kwoniella heveanensis BCC8398]